MSVSPLLFSIIIPVYNRPEEMRELLESLIRQTVLSESKNSIRFEIVVVEDGSTLSSKDVVASYQKTLSISYFAKENTGPGDSRNFGMAKAKGDYIILFDSDCLIPPTYFEVLGEYLGENQVDAFGGADAAHESFSNVQKAINFAMTSIFTTGGIRGKEKSLDNYQPRSFNMGFRRSLFDTIGGFSDVHPGEDPDLSYRFIDAGLKVVFVPGIEVFHKRRIDFSKFSTQVYKFGVVRNFLTKWYPHHNKLVYKLPSLFLLGSLGLCLLMFFSIWSITPLLLLALLLFIEALAKEKSLAVALMAVPASFIQLWAYGYGYLKGFWKVHVLGREEREVFPEMFFVK